MAFCKNCGFEIVDGANNCTNCGTPVDKEPAVPVAPVVEPANDSEDAQKNKAMGILSYIGFLVFIPLFGAKDSKFAQFHAKQGLTLFILEVAYSIAVGIIKGILYAIFPWRLLGVYYAISSILSLASIFFLVMAILGIVNAAQGQKTKLPIVGELDFIAMFKKNK